MAQGDAIVLRSSDNVVVSRQFGLASVSDVPVPGDYDGDGKTDYAVWRQDTGWKTDITVWRQDTGYCDLPTAA